MEQCPQRKGDSPPDTGLCAAENSGFFYSLALWVENPYLSEQWFSAVEIAADEAGKQGLEVWLYDEDGWPSGFAGGLVVASDASLCIQRLRLERSLAACRGMRIAACFRRTNNGWESCTPERADCFFAAQSDLHYVDLLNPEACRAVYPLYARKIQGQTRTFVRYGHQRHFHG